MLGNCTDLPLVNVIEDENARFEIELNSTAYSSLSEVEATYRVVNLSSIDNLVFNFNDGCQVDFKLEKEGNVVLTNQNRICSQALTSINLLPTQQTYFDIIPERAESFEEKGPGKYTLTVQLAGDQGVPVSIDFIVE